jgi:hypothetical protein
MKGQISSFKLKHITSISENFSPFVNVPHDKNAAGREGKDTQNPHKSLLSM